jgi:methylglutamate dehydrogenase subunit B
VLIGCPWCGERDRAEFAYGGDASVRRPGPDADDEAWMRYVFLRENPRGGHTEWWHHFAGCRRWIAVQRDTATHAVGASSLATDTLP